MTALSEETRRRVEGLRDRYPQPRSAILPCLWAVQEELGWLAPEGMSEVAAILGLQPSEVQAVATFYTMYFKKPGGRHHVLLCVNAACALRGADDTAAYLERRLGVPSGGTTADGAFSWEATIECLGGCGYAPVMQVDHHFHEHLTPDRIDAVLERVGAEPSPYGHGPRAEHAAGPQARPHPVTAEAPPSPTAEGPPSADGGEAASRRRRSRGDGTPR